jgi:uncharacterized protein (TIGR00255 family)
MNSMTGFGAAEASVRDVRISIEVRSVNQRHLDIKIVAPREYGPWEAALRRVVAQGIARGRVEVFVGRGAPRRAREISLQKDVAAAYIKAWKQLKKEFGLAGELELGLLQGRAELFQPAEAAADAKGEIATVKKVLNSALAAHARERSREGAHLKSDMVKRTSSLRKIRAALAKNATALAPKLRERLEKRVAKLLGGADVDPARLVQETAILAERADVTEELVRLDSHIESLRSMLADSGPLGKRIDFLLQEINRELNTIGSKAGDLEVTRLVMEGKSEVEKVREQVQNVE